MTERYPNSDAQDAAEPDSATHEVTASRSAPWRPFQRLAAHYAEQLFDLAPLDREEYPNIAQIVDEVANRLNLPAIRMCRLVKNHSDMIVPIGIIPPDTLFLDLALFEQLTAEEQKAIVTHELTHLTQPMADVTIGKLLATTAYAAQTALDSRNMFQGGRISQWLNRLVNHGVSKVSDAEYEADANGAAVTSAETMKRAMVKLLVWSLEAQGIEVDCDLDQSADAIATELDELLPMMSTERIVNGGSWSERFAALDASSNSMSKPPSRIG